MNTQDLTAKEIEDLKEQAYRDGWNEGFEYCLSLFNKPIPTPDNEVQDKLESPLDTFLSKLKW